MVGVAELANVEQVCGLRAADFMAILTIVHVRKIFAPARRRPHAVTLEAGRMSLLYSQLIFARTRRLDPPVTIRAPGALPCGELEGRAGGRFDTRALDQEILRQGLAVRRVREVYPEIAAYYGVQSLGLLFEVEQGGARPRSRPSDVAYAAEGQSPAEKFLREVMTPDAGRVAWEGCDLYILRRYVMACVTTDFGMILPPVVESRALFIAARALRRGPAAFFGMGWRESEIRPRDKEKYQNEYALFKSQHHQVTLRATE
jgi:hypothetical protein